MKEFMLTFKLLLKQNLSLGYFKERIKFDKKFRNMLLAMIFVLILCLPSYILLINTVINIFETFQTLYLESLFIVMAIFLSIFLIIFFGMFQIIAYFYFSSDVKLMTPLPINPKYYLISKFFIIYLWELILSLFVILPFFIVYGVYQQLFIYQWVGLAICFLLIPVIPLIIIGVLTVLLMNITNFVKNKDAIRMFGYIIMIGGLLLFQMYIYRNFLPQSPEEQVNVFEKLINNSSYFLDRFSVYYPITKLIDYALNGTALEAFLGVFIFILVSVIFLYLFSLFLERVFVKGYLKEHANPAIKKKKYQPKTYKKRSVSVAIARIDFITLLKVPIYAFNTFGVILILPVMFIIMSISVGGNETTEMLTSFYKNYKIDLWLVIILFLTVTASMIPIAATSFSREGKTNWIMRTLPISSKDHIKGRLLTPVITLLVFNVIMITLTLIFLSKISNNISEDFIYGAISLIISLILSLPILIINLYVDLKKPLLNWENPQQAVKQNLNVLISLGVGFAYGTILFLSYNFVFKRFLPYQAILIIYFVSGFVLAYYLYRFIKKDFYLNLIDME